MRFLKDYKEAIGKTLKEVREFYDSTFDDPIQFTLMVFSDDTALLIKHEYWNGIIDSEHQSLDIDAKRVLGL
jgi:hypothetical protein